MSYTLAHTQKYVTDVSNQFLVSPLSHFWLETHPACGLKHFEVQRVSGQLALYFSKGVAGGHASHKLGLDKILLVGIFL